jgi:hypothetical protein
MRHTITIFCLGLLPFFAMAQFGAVRGNVFDKETAQPVSFATVQVQGQNRGTTTDINGFFTIPNIPEGSQKLVVSYLGYDSTVVSVTIKKNEIAYQTIYLVESGNKLGEIVVSGKKAQAKSEVQISKLSVTPK